MTKIGDANYAGFRSDRHIFYPNAENSENRYDIFGETPTNVLLVGESVFRHVLTAFSLYGVAIYNLQPITTP